MMSAVKGYYDGKQIVINEDVKMSIGQEVIITILDMPRKKKKRIDLEKYMGRGKKMFTQDAQDYVKELRDNDRL
ncbi:MAG: hypothetical protein K1W40_21385 [Schaedlerella sp.]|uniref:hypothetical protein n=1 Tax=Schaedlerella sp. TaxID=2676057 RepID=UPI002635A089|nr:hypothetical protein [uncultured Schaedlerella sp.]